MASKGLGPLPRRRGSELARGCGRGGRVALPLARAAAVSTGLRVLEGDEVHAVAERGDEHDLGAEVERAQLLIRVRVRVRVRVRIRVRARVRVRVRVKP